MREQRAQFGQGRVVAGLTAPVEGGFRRGLSSGFPNRFALATGALLALGIIGVLIAESNRAGKQAAVGLDATEPLALSRIVGDDLGHDVIGWVRLRGRFPAHLPAADSRDRRQALRALNDAGVRSMAFIRGGDYQSVSGSRRDLGRNSLPQDLRESHLFGMRLGATLGHSLHAWEIDNEPDVGFVPENPENYAAFLKALYLGLHAGAERTIGWRTVNRPPASAHRSPRAARVVMAPLALPPGPYFQALVDNGLFSYTDGFNYHYYGYAEDFSGMYRLFEAAVTEQGAGSGEMGASTGGRRAEGGDAPRSQLRALPVFMSEYGYPLLSGKAAETTEGRVRQWSFFREALKQAHELQIEAPMAFYLPPYLEYGIKEFGLTVRPVSGERLPVNGSNGAPPFAAKSELQSPSSSLLAPQVPSTAQRPPSTVFRAGGVELRPEDFGATEVEPWMRDIGRKIGEWEATPAMAWLMNQPGISQSRPWVVRADTPSPVVIDFVSGDGMAQAKSYSGHFLTERSQSSAWQGRGELRVYNFGRAEIAGRLVFEGVANHPEQMPVRLRVGQMRAIPLELTHPGETGVGQRWRVNFIPDRPGPVSRFSSWVFPNLNEMTERAAIGFQFEVEAAKTNARTLDERQRATEEEALFPRGRWRVSKGVEVVENDDVWRITVNGFPDEPMRPAVVELPLPDGFRFAADRYFLMEVRLVPRTVAQVYPADEPRSHPDDSSLAYEPLWPHVRSATGNLFMMALEFPVRTHWQQFRQRTDNFTPAFYGRMELPWRFMEHRPAALVFHFRPRLLPAVYEIRKARVVELSAEAVSSEQMSGERDGER